MGEKYKKGKDGYYLAKQWDRTYVDGKKHLVNLRSRKSSRDLEKIVEEFNSKMDELGGAATVDPNITLKDLADEWVRIFKAQKEIATQDYYRVGISKFGDIGKVRVSDLTKKDLQLIINENSGHPKTCVKIDLAYRCVIKYAISCHLLRPAAIQELCEGVSKPKYIPPERRILTEEEQAAIRKAKLNVRERAFISLALGCGLRREEIIALTPFDFKDSCSSVHIHKAVGFDRSGIPHLKDTKNHVTRDVPIPEGAKSSIEALIHSWKASEGPYLYFMLRDTKRACRGDLMTQGAYKELWDDIRNAVVKEMPSGPVMPAMTAHMCRHTYCTQLCYQIPKITIKKIARLLGDTESMVTNVYSHIMEEKEDVKSALKAVNSML